MREHPTIFDTIILKGNKNVSKSYYGVIDCVNPRFVQFFDFTEFDDADMTSIVIAWKVQSPEMRFSLFCLENFPNKELPEVKVLNRNFVTIEFSDVENNHKAPKIKRRKLKV